MKSSISQEFVVCMSIFPVYKSVCVMSACDTNYAKSPPDRLNMSKKIRTEVPTQPVPGWRHSPAQQGQCMAALNTLITTKCFTDTLGSASQNTSDVMGLYTSSMSISNI